MFKVIVSQVLQAANVSAIAPPLPVNHQTQPQAIIIRASRSQSYGAPPATSDGGGKVTSDAPSDAAFGLAPNHPEVMGQPESKWEFESISIILTAPATCFGQVGYVGKDTNPTGLKKD